MGVKKISLELEWEGPYKLNELKSHHPKEDDAGVYILARGSSYPYHIHYIGQSKYLRRRLREHLMWYLGGGYVLYDPADLKSKHINSNDLDPKYDPDKEETVFFEKFIADLSKMQKLAHDNLKEFTYFWAPIVQKNEWDNMKFREVLEAVESGLITAADKNTIENQKVSRASNKAPRIQITSKLCRLEYPPNGVFIFKKLKTIIQYGEK